MSSPFPYETYAQKTNFYGRSDEKLLLKKYADESNNLVIYSKRRMGKSSLVKEAFRGSDFLYVYCDIYDITSAEEFGDILLKSLSNSIKGDIKSVAKKLKDLFVRIIPEFTVDPNTGEVSIKPSTKALSFDEMLDEFFKSLFKLSKNQNIVVAIDEFQQISEIKDVKIDAKLRKYMQEEFNISYIFLGSKRHMLNSLFEYKSPLFEMATPLLLQPLEVEDIYEYAKQHIQISIDNTKYIYELADKETKLIQHILHILYYTCQGRQINKDDIDSALKEILLLKSSSYKVIYDTFSQYQKRAFKALVKNSNGIYTKNVLNELRVSKATMSSSLKQLYKREIIDKEDNTWFVPDRAFELWGKKMLN